ncbi:MAG: four helix bundle protein [Firmicutes bacterium]|nr:four helix bundle protein [Bacillota bacterium]
MEGIIYKKSFDFAVRIYRLYKYLKDDRKELEIASQLLRCGTSIGANVSEAKNAPSKKDFKNKMNIALKEARETEFWLRLLNEVGLLKDLQYESIIIDCSELIKILVSIIKSSQN